MAKTSCKFSSDYVSTKIYVQEIKVRKKRDTRHLIITTHKIYKKYRNRNSVSFGQSLETKTSCTLSMEKRKLCCNNRKENNTSIFSKMGLNVKTTVRKFFGYVGRSKQNLFLLPMQVSCRNNT